MLQVINFKLFYNQIKALKGLWTNFHKRYLGPNEPVEILNCRYCFWIVFRLFWRKRFCFLRFAIIFIDYLEKGRTITRQYYADLFGRFEAELMKKTKKKVLFHHDNAAAQSSAIATTKLAQLRYELLPHPLYSPDLAPCDCFLFPNM